VGYEKTVFSNGKKVCSGDTLTLGIGMSPLAGEGHFEFVQTRDSVKLYNYYDSFMFDAIWDVSCWLNK